ncbi:patatin family protein [Bifidobacterium sp. SMA15]|uniref:Patatin family protein n=2 Tax=Bifidobacterium platyrrhinorum TaxID=2661628 RepID=A0A6L9SRF8_9BIFI|nr:patatin family protein [Bifidobacterium platyrrhinorum]
MIDVGGGFRAIFGCGVMDYMLEEGIDVDMCYGVSAGAANMTSFIARQHGRNHTFYTKFAFRKEYASAESFFKNHNFANLDYIYGTLSNHDGEYPVDFDAFEANPTGFTVIACNAEDGSTKYFDKSRIRFDDFDVVKASSAVPVACEPYVVDGVPYYDGGIADPVPVQKALDDGYDKVILILSRLRDEVRQQRKDLAPARILERTYPAAAERLRMRYKTYNDEIELAKRYEAEGRVLILAPEDLYGLNTLKKSFEGLEMMYRKGYAAAEASVKGFLEG